MFRMHMFGWLNHGFLARVSHWRPGIAGART
jgi:hypothetical protein